MEDLEGYLRQGEPGKAEKARAWRAAIGLQQVDGLKPSDYLIATAKQNIEGDITIEEVKQRIDSYYAEHPARPDTDRTEEADKVSARIAEILGEQTFTFSSAGYIAIHRRLFQGINEFAGHIRDYNITKPEWVLNGETVLYAGADSLKAALDHDIEQEKKFCYKGLDPQGVVEHLAQFVSNLWQIHPFGEGNTRTTAVFLMKYLHKLGYKAVNNDLFAAHSWYFRNALVRANFENVGAAIHKTDRFLIRFLANLLLNEQHELRNRALHVHYVDPLTAEADTVRAENDLVNAQNDLVNDPVDRSILHHLTLDRKANYAELAERTGCSSATIKRHLQRLKRAGIIERIGSDKTGHWKVNQP
jgi:fido (protein-threonine AMPylation protein)